MISQALKTVVHNLQIAYDQVKELSVKDGMAAKITNDELKKVLDPVANYLDRAKGISIEEGVALQSQILDLCEKLLEWQNEC